jgi:tRNA(fMet)-specific endonuclease VapC
MGVLIDASVFTRAERGLADLMGHVRDRTGEPVFVSVVSVSEILFGAHRASTEADRKRLHAIAEALLTTFTILEIDAVVARAHARLNADLAIGGTSIAPHDLWLAATCLTYGLRMVTANVREYCHVPGLAVEVWQSR